MSIIRLRACKRAPLAASVLAALLTCTAFAAAAQDSNGKDASAKVLDTVTVTGSLLPQAQIENATPVTVIKAEDIKARGFTTVADVLQKVSFATGGVQGPQTAGSFTQGAQTTSMFGLPPGYVKYLIDGRPMSNYPALYNGTDTFNNISGIPIDLVDRIEILPGGQSSLYGSDAIAGVINIILKKQMQGTSIDIRGGSYKSGGGNDFRTSIASGWSSKDGRVDLIGGLQYEDSDPIWGYQRGLTRAMNMHGYSTAIPSRDILIYSNDLSDDYVFPSGANCSAVAGLYGGTTQQYDRAGHGTYCGSYYSPGYYTIANGKKSTQGYLHGTFDVNDNVQVYGDALVSHENTTYNPGGYWWGTAVDLGQIYDQNLGELVNIQRSFAPEEIGTGGFSDNMNTNTDNSTRINLGIKGTLGSGNWDYDFGLSYTQYKLAQRSFNFNDGKVEDWFADHVLGQQLGTDPIYGYYPVFAPNYAALYSPMSPADLASFTQYSTNHSKTSDGMARLQLTNASLFALPGGDAGLAVVAEAGRETWDYTPDQALLDGDIWGMQSVAGNGQRHRYAVTSELRLPVLQPLTATVSGRYDSYTASGHTQKKGTYSLGLEYRPAESLLLRGKYGNAFRAATLADLYQGKSGYYNFVPDYYQCSQYGVKPDDVANCPGQYGQWQYLGYTSGNIGLKPITAKVWSGGLVWSPLDRMAVTLDYFNWNISNEVTQQDAGKLSLQDYRCRTGLDDMASALCQSTESQVIRDANGDIETIYTPKINVSNSKLQAVTASFRYGFDIGGYGSLAFDASYTQDLKYRYQQYAGDSYVNLLDNPYWGTDPKRKTEASLTWERGPVSATWYANWMGSTPNYAATLSDAGYAGDRAGKLASYITQNLSVSYRLFDGMDLSLMVDNVFNRMPPYDSSYPGTYPGPYNSNNYNVYGRAYYLELHYNFGAK